ncbi:hypothetical protein N657DRAFT_685669 [Parathielavia appendiculata]|uniref:Uncharacterized protein n=1 Tax=Parathielavia appendiculata TaxID=2587402 RepID=A0AAN6U7V6_9PEZI|nr:hypothetical protein N657DRAFT_685669 [Parathielavia appendiculata]
MSHEAVVFPPIADHEKPDLDLALFRVNKQISAEATHYFYSTNTFILMDSCEQLPGNRKKQETWEHSMKTCPWPNHRLDKINTTNARSLRNIHLHIHTEYFDGSLKLGDFICILGRSAPYLTRLAIVPEAHRKCDASCRALHPYARSRHHNWVVPLSEDAVRHLLVKLRRSMTYRRPGGYRGLKVLQIGGAQGREHMDRISTFGPILSAGTRVQGIEGSVAWRGSFGLMGMLWEDMDAQTRWYDALPGKIGVVTQTKG